MVLGKWGSFGRFVLLTTGIGAVSAPGLFVGVPACGALRLCFRALPGRKSALVFFFALGVISALIGYVVVVVLTGGLSMYTFDSVEDLVRALGCPALTAGILTAAASYLVVEPADDTGRPAPLPS